MSRGRWPYFLTIFLSLIWLVNGAVCKVLNLVPRHQLIVERILPTSHGRTWTILIGVAEIVMGIWVFSGIKSRWSSMVQIVVISIMNILEFWLAPDLLLWGRWNALFAFFLVLLVYYHGFMIGNFSNKKVLQV